MRWVIGAWRGSAAAKAAEISGIEDLQDVMNKKRIRWAASVYARHLPQLREIAQPILEEAFGTHSVEWQWMDEPVPMDQRLEIEEVEWCESKVDGYSDGSRFEEWWQGPIVWKRNISVNTLLLWTRKCLG